MIYLHTYISKRLYLRDNGKPAPAAAPAAAPPVAAAVNDNAINVNQSQSLDRIE